MEVQYLLRPAKHGKGKQPRGEPGIKDIGVWHGECAEVSKKKKYMCVFT